MAFDWYPFNPIHFRRDTYHLCAAADGIYRRLLDEYYDTQAPLPDNDQALAAIARIGVEEWMLHRDVVRAFFKPNDGKLKHTRCDKELDTQRIRAEERSRQAREAIAIRWAKHKLKQTHEYGTYTRSNTDVIRNDTTLQRKKDRGAEPDAKEPSEGVVVTSSLIGIFKEKGWVR